MLIIKENLLRVMERIERAARKAGRDPKEINLVAVSKTVEVARIKEAIEAGVSILGENYIQEAQKKIEEIGRPACTERFGEAGPSPGTSSAIFNRTRRNMPFASSI